jgi:hypothetical protein
MRTRILKLARGGASIALLATGLGAVGALGIGLASSGVASATGAKVTTQLGCTAGTGLLLLVLKSSFSVTTSTATLHINTTKALTITGHFTVTTTLVHTAVSKGETHLTIAGSTVTLALTGFTNNVAKKATQTGTVHVTLVTGSPASVTLHFKDTVTMTAASGVTATVKVGPDLNTTVLVSVKCKTENSTFAKKTFARKPAPTTTTPTYAATSAVLQGPIDTIKSAGYAPLTLSPAAGALPAGQATRLYTSGGTYWTAAGGHGTDTWSATGVPAGMSFAGSGSHASLTGTPTTAGTYTLTVTVKTKTAATVTQKYTLTIAAAPSTPKVIQPFELKVTPGTLTLTCATATGATKPTVKQDVTVQATAKNCTLVTLGSVKLNEKRQVVPSVGHNLIISTARGGAKDSWALYAVMVPTSTKLTGNAVCNEVQGFCNKTTTNATTFPSHIINTTITPNYLGVTGKCDTNHTNPATTYYNDNPTPTATAGVAPGATGLSVQTELCSAATGFSGGQFFETTLDYTLIVPPNVYAGTYYGTVLYTLSETAAKVPSNPITPPQ